MRLEVLADRRATARVSRVHLFDPLGQQRRVDQPGVDQRIDEPQVLLPVGNEFRQAQVVWL